MKSYSEVDAELKQIESEAENEIKFDLDFVRMREKEVKNYAKNVAGDMIAEDPELAATARMSRMNVLTEKIREIDHKITRYQASANEIVAPSATWFKEMIEESYILPLVKERFKLYREWKEWNDPHSVPKFEGQLTDQQITEARESDCSEFVDIVRHDGQRGWARCPWHEDKTPSFCCYEGGRGFYCFSCNKGGDAITLVRELHKMEFAEAVRYILQKYATPSSGQE